MAVQEVLEASCTHVGGFDAVDVQQIDRVKPKQCEIASTKYKRKNAN